MTTTQFSQCIVVCGSGCGSARVARLEEREQPEHEQFRRDHPHEYAADVRAHGWIFFGAARSGSRPALSRFTKSRGPPGTPPGIWRNSESDVNTYMPLPSGVMSSAPLFSGSPGSCISSGVE